MYKYTWLCEVQIGPILGEVNKWDLRLLSTGLYISIFDTCVTYCRKNPNNGCRLEVTVNSYFTVHEGKKLYNRGKTIKWNMHPEEYALMDPYFKWGSNQKATFWVVQNGGLDSKLTSDAQLVDRLRSSNQVKLFMVVGGHEKGKEFPTADDGVAKDMAAAVDVTSKEAYAAADMVCKEMPITTDPVDKETHDVAGVVGKEIPMVADDGDDECLLIWKKSGNGEKYLNLVRQL